MREREDIGDSFLLILYAQRHSCVPMFHRIVFRNKANKLYKRPQNRYKDWNEMCIKPSEYKLLHYKDIIVHYWGESEIRSCSFAGSGAGVY